MPTTIPVVAFIVGSVLIVIALFGGNIEAFNIKMSGTIGKTTRLAAGLAGLSFTVLAIWLSIFPSSLSPSQPGPTSVAQFTTPTPAVPTSASVSVAPVTTVPANPPVSTVLPTATATPRPILPTPTAQEREFSGAPMVFVVAGEFTMGSNDIEEEKPRRAISLDAFWIDKYLVTNSLYKKCVDAGRCQRPNPTKSSTREMYYGNAQYDNYPVISVAWSDANAFCSWAGKKLPTEAQWEKAARGTDERTLPWGNEFDKNLANSKEGGKSDTTAVGSYPSGASPYGAMDMAGNVWEWVADFYDANYYKHSPQTNPRNETPALYRVVRGGSWYNVAGNVRSVGRYYVNPEVRDPLVGFRCVQ